MAISEGTSLRVIETMEELRQAMGGVGTEVALSARPISFGELLDNPSGWGLKDADNNPAPTLIDLLRSGALRMVNTRTSIPAADINEAFQAGDLAFVDRSGVEVKQLFNMSQVYAFASGFFALLARRLTHNSPGSRMDWRAPSLLQGSGHVVQVVDPSGYLLIRIVREPCSMKAGEEGVTLTITYQGSPGKVRMLREGGKPPPPFSRLLLPTGDPGRSTIDLSILRSHHTSVLGDGNRIDKGKGNDASLVVMHRDGMTYELVRADMEYGGQQRASSEFALISPAAHRAALAAGYWADHLNELASLILLDKHLLLQLAESFKE